MVNCWAPLCSHNSVRESCSFFRFPTDMKLRNSWAKIVRRADSIPSSNSRLCSCHFKDSFKENGPSIFAWNENQVMNFVSPEKRKRTKIVRCSEEENCDDTSSSTGNSSVIEKPHDESADLSFEKITILEKNVESYFLKKENEDLKKEIEVLKKNPFGYQTISKNNNMFQYYTGLSEDMFEIIVTLCSNVTFNYYLGWNVTCFSLHNQILMTLMKLKLNLGHKDLAFRFMTSSATVSNITLTFIILLHDILFKSLMDNVPSQLKNQLCLPNCFQNFNNCRMIIDCTEVSCDVPKQLDQQKLTYSNYKHRNTLKGLLGIAPNGVITYVSKLYPGSTSDKKIVGHCGVLNIFQPGDLILADKGFLISDLLPSGVYLNIPPFLVSPQFTPSEVEKTKNIARARIHVERAIQRLKEYQILSHIPKHLYVKASIVFQLCAALVNFKNPLIKEVDNLYISED